MKTNKHKIVGEINSCQMTCQPLSSRVFAVSKICLMARGIIPTFSSVMTGGPSMVKVFPDPVCP